MGVGDVQSQKRAHGCRASELRSRVSVGPALMQSGCLPPAPPDGAVRSGAGLAESPGSCQVGAEQGRGRAEVHVGWEPEPAGAAALLGFQEWAGVESNFPLGLLFPRSTSQMWSGSSGPTR